MIFKMLGRIKNAVVLGYNMLPYSKLSRPIGFIIQFNSDSLYCSSVNFNNGRLHERITVSYSHKKNQKQQKEKKLF